MILRGAAANRYFAKPDPAKAVLLIHGEDTSRVTQKRAEAALALAGPGAESEMRLARMAAAEARRDPAALSDALRSQGFFPGPRVVVLDDATDGLAPVIEGALAEWRLGDASLIVTAGALTTKSVLRVLVERHPAAVAVELKEEPPGPEEIAAELARAGLAKPDPAVMDEIIALSRTLDPGDFRQTVERIGLYKWRDPAPLTLAEVAACAPLTAEAEVDDLALAVVEGRAGDVPRLIRRLLGQGVAPVGVCLAVQRLVRAMQATAGGGGGWGVPYALRDAVARAQGAWPMARIEAAMASLVETDLTLRSSSRTPGMALVERVLLRLAMRR